MKELLIQNAGIDVFTFLIFVILSVWTGVLIGWRFFPPKEKGTCPYCGNTLPKQLIKNINPHTDALLKKADKAIEAADKYMKKQGYIISEEELKKQEKKTRKQIKKINKKLGV